MPIDPHQAITALVRAEAVRIASHTATEPPNTTVAPAAAPTQHGPDAAASISPAAIAATWSRLLRRVWPAAPH
ncbi:hypothetical protein [Streptomyces montanisoli]|uniref:Uncharacterized protein n=1 Tax=Streptomyces montanisoli TaxID=2798581 RepID=A0A940RVG2_9ACTN|nr:hypothetical protein [Streptomyces montanisoli]MBP0456068.1 hypothetical protein [Streptomyces montanisoli]